MVSFFDEQRQIIWLMRGMMKKVADGSLLGNRIFINSKKGTQSVPALSEPIYELKVDDSPERIGEKVRKCIEAYEPVDIYKKQ